MDFVLIDYQPRDGQINRDQTGTFGSSFETGGWLGQRLARLKSRNVRLPVVSFSYANAVLRAHGHRVQVVTHDVPDAGGDVAIFATVMYHWQEDLAFLREYRRRHPSTRLGVIGGFSKTMPELYAADVDFFINTDIEEAVYAFLQGRWEWQGTFDGAGFAPPLDELPMPSWAGFPVERYAYRPALRRKPFLVMQSARGCSFNCTFCPYMVTQSTKIRHRTPQQLEAEIRYLHGDLGVRSILFRDILFGVPKSHAESVADVFAALRYDIEWAMETHINALSEPLIKRMTAAGLRVVNLGIESADPETLGKSGKKPVHVERIEETVALLHRYGVRVQAFYMLGLQADTPETMAATIAFAKTLNTFSAQFCVTTPFPGTRFYEEVKDNLLHRDWSRFTEYEPVLQVPNVTPLQVRDARDTAYRTYYRRARWMLRHGPGVVRDLVHR
ncbi:MAG TPA: radical SAM protein [Terriglobales bacterium]|nr:radical SAM protein [Terriglobales bacterium]